MHYNRTWRWRVNIRATASYAACAREASPRAGGHGGGTGAAAIGAHLKLLILVGLLLGERDRLD